ncbi:transcriptional regulator containing PAS, AAA-type ATPase, and DNA-binding domains [Desulfosporosinus orientis DSM 765]|uniref:Transcriptional regulator containing PAS, AAA-type ATPase, and DNA-binding domains n=1 Tax=Desulfosporosinus orientis (strain ATCC 19365 / DSM 765 / NCIMB 8382 / VKM B-1628 / Singapore I) TaxID=768706 RepID=G7W6E3_DESOD|nr:sigma 54-interacting transcriptional regulator [Desulfosporosinus orientis]AET68150.1 transcriptional regulator containing PAS, AAA-type ATPase, and DNA-binding domains [Desulfosporosinus orientis DSM 765]
MTQPGISEQADIPVLTQYLKGKETYEFMVECKEDFLKNSDFNPQDYSTINPLIIGSWLRSRNYQVDPFKKSIDSSLNCEVLAKKEKKNKLLIEATLPLMEAFKGIAIKSSYNLGLIDQDGILILTRGNLNLSATALSATVGSDWSENAQGTNAHSLCLQGRKPVQLLGPLAYGELFKDFIGYAAPIRDESGEILATINLAQPILYKPWENKFQVLSSHTMSLIIAMALAVESKLQVIKSYNALSYTHKRLESTLEIVDEGIITIDKYGQILNINKEGNRILGRRESDELPSICNYLSGESRLMSMINAGENGNVEESLLGSKRRNNYLINVNIIYDLNTGEVESAVLRLNHIDKINSLANSRLGVVPTYRFNDLMGKSPEFLKAIQLAKNFAQSSENILLIGESGTGKELFAQSIHNASRSQEPFIAVNCAAIPRNLIESELFGYEKGSFTGADRSGRPGKIELANGGTLFLDEIGDMPIELQAVLLRVLQDKQVMRIGGQHSRRVDFRLIAATNKELDKMVDTKFFRGDLFFRLSVLSIEIPPLRKRGHDIQLLSQYFLDSYCHKMGIRKAISPEALGMLRKKYDWPGNVRQLENAIIYAINAAVEHVIKPEDLPATLVSGIALKNTMDCKEVIFEEQGHTLKNCERNAILNALAAKNNNVAEAALLLNIAKSTLYKKIKKYHIKLRY